MYVIYNIPLSPSLIFSMIYKTKPSPSCLAIACLKTSLWQQYCPSGVSLDPPLSLPPPACLPPYLPACPCTPPACLPPSLLTFPAHFTPTGISVSDGRRKHLCMCVCLISHHGGVVATHHSTPIPPSHYCIIYLFICDLFFILAKKRSFTWSQRTGSL